MKVPSIKNVDTNERWFAFLWTETGWNEVGVADSEDDALLLLEGGDHTVSSFETLRHLETNLCLGYKMPVPENKPEPPSAEIILGLAARYPSGN